MGASQGLIDQLRAVQLAALDAAPWEVKNNTWYQQFREGVNNFNQTGESAQRAFGLALQFSRGKTHGRCWAAGYACCECGVQDGCIQRLACARGFARVSPACVSCSPVVARCAAVNVAAKTPSSDNCKPGCISLNFLAGLAQLDSTCICLTNTITNVQHGLAATQQVRRQSSALCLAACGCGRSSSCAGAGG